MKDKKNIFLSFMLMMICLLCRSQMTEDTIQQFEKLIFHSGQCNGACPRIDFEIDKERNILLSRQIFTKKGETDKSKSGHFKGILDNERFGELLQQLRSSNYENLKFPAVDCCDGVVTTIIIYSNRKRKYLKSMAPPRSAFELISYLLKLGVGIKLPKTDQEINIER